MGDVIHMNDVKAEKLSPEGLAKLREWAKMAELRNAYIASVKAEVAKGDERP